MISLKIKVILLFLLFATNAPAQETVWVNDPGPHKTQKVYVMGDEPISRGYVEATISGDISCTNTDKSHILSGWEHEGTYSHHEQTGAFWCWRVGSNYNPFKFLATPQGLPERKEDTHSMSISSDPHIYRFNFNNGRVSFVLDGDFLQEWQFSRFVMKVLVIGRDDLYPQCNPPLTISNIKVVEYTGDPPTPTITPTAKPTPTADPNVPIKVNQYDIFEVNLPSGMQWDHPFTQVNCYGHFREEGKGWVQRKGFYNGSGNWIVRYRPDKTGMFDWKTFSAPEHSIFIKSGKFDCIAPRSGAHGPMRRDGLYLKHHDGTDPYWIGATAFGLPEKDVWQQYLDKYLAKGIRYYRVGSWFTIECSNSPDCFLGLVPFKVFPYPCETQTVDWTEMNVQQMQRLDGIMKYLHEHNAYAEVCLYSGRSSEELCGDGDIYTVSDSRQIPYLDYMAARFRAYPNLIWEIGNEIRNWSGGNQWEKARTWVDWVGQTMKRLDPEHLVSYDAQWWEDPWWVWEPAIYPDWKWIDISHKPCWEAHWCDIVNAHTDRHTGVWWYRGPEQMRQLSSILGKPVNNDEPHRKGYGGVVTNTEIRRAAYLTIMIGNAYHTIHGVSGKGMPVDPLCDACVQEADLAGDFTIHLNKFFDELGCYNFEQDRRLIEGAGIYLRAMHRNGVYVYSAFDAQGQFKLKTKENATYEIKVMNAITGQWVEDRVETGKDFMVNTSTDFVAYARTTFITPTPTVTHTETQTPTPTLTLTPTVSGTARIR